MGEHDAEERWMRPSVAPAARADRLPAFSSPLRLLVVGGALALGLIALWLCFVVVAVLPARDPRHVPMWTGIAAAFLGYALVTLLFVVRGPRPAWLPWAVVACSLAALAFGGYAVVSMLRAGDTGARFEGYLLLMGAILAAQGACALAYTALASASARRLRGVAS
jgi:hypothetical protein